MAHQHETQIPDRLTQVGTRHLTLGIGSGTRIWCALSLPPCASARCRPPFRNNLASFRFDAAHHFEIISSATHNGKSEGFKPRFKVDHAALPMPEPNQQERLAPRGDIKSERGRHHNLYTPARSSECAPYAGNHLERRLQCQRLLSSFLSTSAKPVS